MKYSMRLFSLLCLLSGQSMTAADVQLNPADVPGFYVEWPEHNGLPTMVGVKKRVERCVTEFQTIEIYETATFGNMMVIDDVIMLTQRDNHGYHEMISHIALNAHPNPQRVLIVGGGDGGTLTQVLKHPSVKEVVLCEIDAKVIELSKTYFPEFSASFSDARTNIVARDATQYIKEMKNAFDVIIVDSTDPFPNTPAEALFERPFYLDMHAALTADGIAITQSEPHFLYTDLVEKLYKQNREIFAHAAYYFTLVPTYPSGTIGFSFCSKKYDPFENVDTARIAQLSGLQYYTPEIHKASFALPKYVSDRLG